MQRESCLGPARFKSDMLLKGRTKEYANLFILAALHLWNTYLSKILLNAAKTKLKGNSGRLYRLLIRESTHTF